MNMETWLAFLVACWIISLSPGVGAIASLSSGLNYGFGRGYWTAIGLQLGLLLQIGVVAAGVGALPRMIVEHVLAVFLEIVTTSSRAGSASESPPARHGTQRLCYPHIKRDAGAQAVTECLFEKPM